MYPEICYSTFFLLHADEVFRRAYLALDFGCSEVADSENWFSRFSPNSGDLSKNKLHHVQLLVNSYQWANCEHKKNFDCGREISILLGF